MTEAFETSEFNRIVVGQSRSVLLFLGVVSIAIGIILLVWPGRTVLVIASLIAIWLVVSGLFQLVSAIFVPADGGTRALTALSGIAGLVLGIMAFRYNSQVDVLGLLIGIGWVMYGTIGTLTGIAAKGIEGRWWMVVAGVLMILGGIVVLVWPGLSLLVLTVVSGIWLIAFGVVEVIHSLQLRKLLA